MPTNKPIFDFIGHQPQHIPTIAEWHQREWHHISPHLTTPLRIKEYSGYASKSTIPCCLIAMLDGQPAGSASLVEDDMETRPDLGPWLASVYVDKPFRQQGIATQLIQQLLDIARQCKIHKLYLFTPSQRDFYARRGWQHLESCIFHDEHVDIMFYDLSEPQP